MFDVAQNANECQWVWPLCAYQMRVTEDEKLKYTHEENTEHRAQSLQRRPRRQSAGTLKNCISQCMRMLSKQPAAGFDGFSFELCAHKMQISGWQMFNK